MKKRQEQAQEAYEQAEAGFGMRRIEKLSNKKRPKIWERKRERYRICTIYIIYVL